MDKFDLSYIPVLAFAASAAIALVNYFNYRLNKTLNIKNHLYTEKLKVYRELTKLLSEMIQLHDQAINILENGTENIETSLATRIATMCIFPFSSAQIFFQRKYKRQKMRRFRTTPPHIRSAKGLY